MRFGMFKSLNKPDSVGTPDWDSGQVQLGQDGTRNSSGGVGARDDQDQQVGLEQGRFAAACQCMSMHVNACQCMSCKLRLCLGSYCKSRF